MKDFVEQLYIFMACFYVVMCKIFAVITSVFFLIALGGWGLSVDFIISNGLFVSMWAPVFFISFMLIAMLIIVVLFFLDEVLQDKKEKRNEKFY